MRFDAYADEAKIGKGDRGKELLSLLDDEPFRLVYRNGLVESKDYSAVCECLTLKVRQDWHGAGVADDVAVPRATTRGVIARLCGRVANDSHYIRPSRTGRMDS